MYLYPASNLALSNDSQILHQCYRAPRELPPYVSGQTVCYFVHGPVVNNFQIPIIFCPIFRFLGLYQTNTVRAQIPNTFGFQCLVLEWSILEWSRACVNGPTQDGSHHVFSIWKRLDSEWHSKSVCARYRAPTVLTYSEVFAIQKW